MFTGLIEAVAHVVGLAERPDGGRLLDVDLGAAALGVNVGDSIALSGTCCTVEMLAGPIARFHLSAETLRRTWFSTLKPATQLNVEGSLRAGQPLGGHIVQGHVDAIGEVIDPVGPAGGDWGIRLPGELLRYCVVKGSIAVEGVSLTIAALADDRAMVAVVPHTAAHTTIGSLSRHHPLNIEADILAKYVERLLQSGEYRAGAPPP